MSNEGLLSSASINPDLDEFLSALNGFLSKQETPADPSHLKFLEIFFRTVKATKGHLLKLDDNGILRSVVSYGISADFDSAYNKARDHSPSEPSPLDIAFREQDALAIVELSKEPKTPSWYLTLMKKHHFVSLVAVPLMGRDKPVGVLCAYYQDACLFDRGTLSHLMMIGRMVGGATERSQGTAQTNASDENESVIDNFLTLVSTKKMSKPEIFRILCQLVARAMNVTAVIAGPVTKADSETVLDVVGGMGIPDSRIGKMMVLPDFLRKGISKTTASYQSGPLAPGDWGNLKTLVSDSKVITLSKVLLWQNKPVGLVVAWRSADRPFLLPDEIAMNRLGVIASLALQTI